MNQFRKPLPDGKVRRHYHAPTTIEIGKTKVSINADGIVTLYQDHDDDSFSEIKVPASTIFDIGNLLNTTRKTKIINREDIPK